ncbi:MAG: hypothetical protein IPK39_23850 [Sulfuritalea sp.]|nr:hypothetical protein [Sulfuritalea sp.]
MSFGRAAVSNPLRPIRTLARVTLQPEWRHSAPAGIQTSVHLITVQKKLD